MELSLEAYQGYLETYGVLAILLIMYLEYLNLPGLPAGLVMTLVGLWANQGGMGFFFTMVVATGAGLLGCFTLYLVGWWAGAPLLKWVRTKFPRQGPYIDRAVSFVEHRGGWGMFLGRLIPVIRTMISIPAGMLRMNPFSYLLFTAGGVCLWNLAYVGAGYYFGPRVLEHFLGA